MFLGIDPGVRKLGYALIDGTCKIIQAGILLQDTAKPTRAMLYEKMCQIASFFDTMLETNEITAVGIEKLYFTDSNQANAEFVYGIRGALVMMLHKKHIPIYEYTPTQLKKNITWHGHATKSLVQTMIQKLYRLEAFPEFDDTADALGLAYLASKAKK